MTYTLPRPPASEAFQGATYEPARDHARLTGQLGAVFDLMRDGFWRSLSEIAVRVDGSQAGVSARLRDLRKPPYGGHTVDKRLCSDGIWEYKLTVNKGQS